MKKVILVGTKHSIQRGPNPRFGSYIESLIVKYCPKAIAEELEQNPTSIARELANSTGLPYLIIEPTPQERIQLGIPLKQEIERDIFMKYKDINSKKAKNESVRRIEDSYRKRELEWFERIFDSNTWPTLVICGAAHYQPFAKLLKEKGIDVINENEDWA